MATTWTAEVRAAALNGVRIAAGEHEKAHCAADRVLAVYLRGAVAHGLTVEEICQATDLDPLVVRDLTDPAAC